MRIQLKDFDFNSENIINGIVEEVKCFIDDKKYLNECFELNLTSIDEDNIDNEMSAYDYLLSSFNVYKTLFKVAPEFLILTKPNVFKEITTAYQLFAKTMDGELVIYSAQQAIEKGISPEWIQQRLNTYSTVLTYLPDELLTA